tara:strand:+ start:118 stop:387 length:270 start_codon:yes stop_codon:yes gene_type:complete
MSTIEFAANTIVESNLQQIKSPGPVPGVVELLEEVLQRARAGQVIGVAVAASMAGRRDATIFELGEGTVASLHLATCRLQRRLLDLELE